MEDPSKFLYMSEEDQHEYEIAERSVSQSIEKMVKLMFRVRRPAILCLTTASLLNTTDPSNGLFRRHSSTFGTIIGDEASQIPEPALVAIASRIPEAKQRHIGDIHQLEPHARCQRNSNPAIFGARSVMSVLVGAAAVPVSPLVTTFRAHPALNALPNLVAYDGTLLNGTGPESRQLLLSAMHFPTPEVPFMFLNIAGKSTKAASKSHFNTDEANACVRLIELLLGKGTQPNQICVISFYKEQSRHLQSRLDRLGVELTTVDSVQGREKEVRQCSDHTMPSRTIHSGQRRIFDESSVLAADPRLGSVAQCHCSSIHLRLGYVAGRSLQATEATRDVWRQRHRAPSTPLLLLIQYPSPCSYSKGEALRTKS
ncbi:hypothetical protein V3C99_003911 [Haemonchus contortus]